MVGVPWADRGRPETRFVDDPPDADLIALLGVLRRPRAEHESPPFEAPDWLPLFASINVLHCCRLQGPARSTFHLIVGEARSSTGGSAAAVFAQADDMLSLRFGPARADEIARGGLVTSALGGLTLQLVPDGIVAAELHFADGDPAVARVIDNLWWHRRPDALEPFARRLNWVAADGSVVRSFEG